MTIRIQSILTGVLVLAVVVVGWLFFAPTQLGGPASYMIIRGVSMHPSIHAGDLVIVRKRSSYSVGEVVAYRDTLSKQTILHRIVARDGARYVFQGDNRATNPHPDAFRPTQANLMGQKWILIPYAGRVLEWIQVPSHAVLLLLLALLLAVSGGAATTRKRRRSKSGPAAAAPSSHVPGLNPLYAIPAVLLALSLALGAVAFSRTKSEQVSVPNGYQQSGDFSYSASAARGIVYPSGRVTSGQTVFSRLVKNVTFSFRYRLTTRESTALSGQATLSASLTSPDNDYTRSFTLAKRSFEGQSVTVVGVFPLRSYTNLLNEVQTETADPSSTYNVVITPAIAIKGMVGTRRINESFAPSLNFLLDAHKLLLDHSNGSVKTHVSKSTAGTATRASTIDLRLVRLGVSSARELSVAGLMLALLSLGVVIALGVKRRLDDEPRQIERRYGHLLLPVSQLPAFDRIVECDSIDALAALADRYDRAILYRRERGVHTYVLQDEGLAYRYSAFDGALLKPESYLSPTQTGPVTTGAPEVVPEAWSVDSTPGVAADEWGVGPEPASPQSSEPPWPISE